MEISFLTFEQYQNIKNKAIVIDVRTKEEYQIMKKIDNSINIYINDLLNNYQNYLPNYDQVIITVCNVGVRSRKAAEALRNLGYKNVYTFKGGIYNFVEVDEYSE